MQYRCCYVRAVPKVHGGRRHSLSLRDIPAVEASVAAFCSQICSHLRTAPTSEARRPEWCRDLCHGDDIGASFQQDWRESEGDDAAAASPIARAEPKPGPELLHL